MIPHSLFDHTLRGGVESLPMLFAFQPLTFVFSAVRPIEYAEPVLQIVLVPTFVLATIRPREQAPALHFVIYPVANKGPTIGPTVDALPLNIIVGQITFETATVRPKEFSFSVLPPI